MATVDGRTPERIRQEIDSERNELAEAVEELRSGLEDATDVAGKLRPRLPALVPAALAAGFVTAGGIGALARLLMRRGREGEPRAQVGRFSLVERR